MGRGNLWQQIKQTDCCTQGAGGNLEIARGGAQTAVSHEELDATHIGARLQQMRGEGVTP